MQPTTVYETDLLARSGRLIPAAITSRVVVRDGEPCGVIAIGRDVTESRAARNALQDSERRFRSAFEDAATGMLLVDRDGALLRVNRAFAAMLGYRPEELTGRRFQELTHADDVETTDAARAEMVEHAGVPSRTIEKRYLRRDGSTVWGHVTISGVRNNDDALRHLGRGHHRAAPGARRAAGGASSVRPRSTTPRWR